MNLDEIRAASERARRFTLEIDGRRFDCVTPTQFEADIITQEQRTFARVQRALVLAALRGWTEVTEADLRLPDADGAPLPYTREMAAVLLDERNDWEVRIADELSNRVRARRE